MKLISIIFLVSIWLNAQTLNLVNGWNVVALQSDTNVSNFNKQFPQIINLFRYDGKWHTDGNIQSSEGIWAYVDQNTSINITPSSLVKNNFEDINLNQGWNLVGLPSPYSIYPKLFDGYTLWRYKDEKWSNKNKKAITTGEAFWIFSENEKTINIAKESSKLYIFDNDLDINNYLETVSARKQLLYYYGNSYGTSTTGSIPVTDGILGDPASMTAPTISSTSTSFATSTNLQEINVDESDIIKHDGKTLFYISKNEKTIKINTFERLSKNLIEPLNSIKLDNYPSELYIKGNNLIVMYPSMTDYISLWNYSPIWRGKSKIELYDVSKIDAINKIANYNFDGNIVNSRIVDDKLYIISRFSPYIETTYKKIDCEVNKPSTPSIPSFLPQPYSTQTQESSSSSSSTIILKSTRENRGCYDYSTLIYGNKFLNPTLYDITNDTNISLLKAQTFFAPPKAEQEPFITTISTFDINTLKYQESISLTTSAYTVYSSANAIYLASHNYPRYYSETVAERRSTIYKIAIGKSLKYRGKIDVSGTLLNQFSLSEYKNVLRVATTVSDNSRETDNRIYTIEDKGEELKILGALKGLGEAGERITGVRFFADKAYVVTFRRIDPLYTVDLSNPSEPKKIGELKIPGFSSYFHQISDELVLSIGRDANLFGRAQGIQLQLFNISDFANPIIVDKVVIGESSTQSSTLNSHKAFTYRQSDKTIAIPISQSTYGYSGIELAELLNTTIPFTSSEPSLQKDESNNILTNKSKTLHGIFLFRVKNETITPLSAIESKNTNYSYENNDRSIIFTFNGLDYAAVIVNGIITVKQIPN